MFKFFGFIAGDLFSVHIVENPSQESELVMLKKYAPGRFICILGVASEKTCEIFKSISIF